MSFHACQYFDHVFFFMCGHRGGGVLTYLAEWGCAALMGRFLQEILKHGSRFLPKKSLNMGQLFLTEPQITWFSGFSPCENPENHWIFFENRPTFEGKSLKMGTLLAKITLKDGYGFWGSSGTPLSNSNLSTPGVDTCPADWEQHACEPCLSWIMYTSWFLLISYIGLKWCNTTDAAVRWSTIACTILLSVPAAYPQWYSNLQ